MGLQAIDYELQVIFVHFIHVNFNYLNWTKAGMYLES